MFEMKKVGIRIGTIFVSALVVYLLYYWAYKPWLRKPTNEDFFFFDVAYDFSSPDICEKINPYAHWVAPWSPIPIGYYQSMCYEQVALKTHNKDLCDRVKPLRTIFHFIGSALMSKRNCLDEVQREVRALNTHMGYYKFSVMLSRVGFTEAKIRTYPRFARFPTEIPVEELFNEFYVALEFGRVPGKDEFLAGVRSLKT